MFEVYIPVKPSHQDKEHTCLLPTFPCVLLYLQPLCLSLLTSSIPQTTSALFSVTVDQFVFSRILHKWSHIVCTLFKIQLLAWSLNILRFILAVILFLQPVVFFCMSIPLSVYPFTFWQIFGLFPVQGQCKVFVSFNIQVFCGHMLEFLLGKYIGMEWLDCMLGVYLTLKTVVVPFSFSASMYERFHFLPHYHQRLV